MIEKVVDESYSREYFWKLYKKISQAFCEGELKLKSQELNKKELIDVLRFADIFSNSKQEDKKNLSYRIISLLYNKYKDEDIYVMYSNAILKKLANFPALKNTPDTELPIERELEHLMNKEILKSPLQNEHFLPSQYHIYEKMKKRESLTF